MSVVLAILLAIIKSKLQDLENSQLIASVGIIQTPLSDFIEGKAKLVDVTKSFDGSPSKFPAKHTLQ